MCHYLVVFLSVVVLAHSAKLPSYFTKCSRTDAKLNECLTNSATSAWPTMVQGDNASHIQQLNPFYVPYLSIPVDDNLKGNLSEATITGLADLKFNDVKIDFDKKTIDIKFTIPSLNFISIYAVSGRLLFFPIEGTGPSNITFRDMVNDLHINYKIKEKSNKEYIEVLSNTMKYKVSRVHFRLDNLFGGDERLGEAMNHVLDESWEAVNEEIGSRMGDAIGTAYAQLLQSFFRRVPLDNFFSD